MVTENKGGHPTQSAKELLERMLVSSATEQRRKVPGINKGYQRTDRTGVSGELRQCRTVKPVSKGQGF
jgi:hypothetical protein